MSRDQEIFSYMNSQELDVVENLHLLTIYVESGMCGRPRSPEVHDVCFGFCGVQDQVVVGTSLEGLGLAV